MDQRGTTTSDRGCNNLHNEMSPDIILDHFPIARRDLLVQTETEELECSSPQSLCLEKLHFLARRNMQDQRPVALGNINAHNEEERPQKLLCRTKTKVRDK